MKSIRISIGNPLVITDQDKVNIRSDGFQNGCFVLRQVKKGFFSRRSCRFPQV